MITWQQHVTKLDVLKNLNKDREMMDIVNKWQLVLVYFDYIEMNSTRYI